MKSSHSSKIRIFVITSASLVALGICICGFMLGKKVPFSTQWPLYEALRNTAAIIFAVVGAWMAIIYPERLRMSFGKSDGNAGERSSAHIRLLLTPAYHSTAILVVLLLIGILAPLVKPLPFVQSNLDWFRGSSYALLAALTCWQIAIVVLAMFPAEAVQTSIDREAARQEIDSSRDRLRQIVRPDRGPS